MSSTRFQPLAGYTQDENREEHNQEPLHFSNSIMDQDGKFDPSMYRDIDKSTRQCSSVPTDEFINDLSIDGLRNRRRSSQLPPTTRTESRLPYPWQHGKIPMHASSTSREFSRIRQTRRIIGYGLLQWLITLAVVLGQFATLYCYGKIEALTPQQKHAFNALIIILSAACGLAVISALRTYMKLLKWRLLASSYHNLQQVELLMHCHEQTKALQLLWKGRTPGSLALNDTQILGVVSLLLFVGLNVTIGLLGLTYSVDTTYDKLNYQWGNVSLVDLSNIYALSGSFENGVDFSTGAANLYGLIGESFWLSPDALLSSNVWSDDAVYYYNLTDATAPTAKTTATAVSDRYLTGAATCMELTIVNGGVPTRDNNSSELVFVDERGDNRAINVYGITNLTSTWIGNTSTNAICGPRCTNILILDSGSLPRDNTTERTENLIQPHLYACNSTISQVENTYSCTYPENCTLSDRNAQYIAGAIGFSGESYENSPLQYKTYPHGHILSWDGNPNISNVASRKAQVGSFSVGVVSAMDNVGPRINVAGWYPSPAVVLAVKWRYAIAVLSVLPILQLLMLVLIAAYTKDTLLRDSGYLSSAQLLRPVVDKLTERGSVLTSDEIAKEMKHMEVVYGIREDRTDYRVDIIAKDELRDAKVEGGRRPTRLFLQGYYD